MRKSYILAISLIATALSCIFIMAPIWVKNGDYNIFNNWENIPLNMTFKKTNQNSKQFDGEILASIKLHKIHRLKTSKDSIFYAFFCHSLTISNKMSDCAQNNNSYFDVYYRVVYYYDGVGYARYSAKDFKLIKDYGPIGIIAQDQRFFTCYNKQFIVQNKIRDVQLIDVTNYTNLYWNANSTKFVSGSEYIFPIEIGNGIKSKNFGWFCFNQMLYFLYRTQPLIIYKIEAEKLETFPNQNKINIVHPTLFYDESEKSSVFGDRNSERNKYSLELHAEEDTFRGGTTGFQICNSSFVVGIGHRTLVYGLTTTHRPYIWLVDMHSMEVYIRTLDTSINEYSDHSLIIDPASIFILEKEYYLVTGESYGRWNHSQDYISNIYKIINFDKMVEQICIK